ncbi:MAG: type II toxin-antitoxin system VapC family toxin [Alphaproteobacteria bacterium]|nr:type II toxin-antitoxin system VapC family toxin [Alphaproteobacteria bacterium]
MRLLIDSHALIWWAEASPLLGVAAGNAIADAANEVLISIAGLWELTIKQSTGKLTLPVDLEAMVNNLGFTAFAISFVHLNRLERLPHIHRDPFDRMMIAQALAEGFPIATRDPVFAAYGVQTIW